MITFAYQSRFARGQGPIVSNKLPAIAERDLSAIDGAVVLELQECLTVTAEFREQLKDALRGKAKHRDLNRSFEVYTRAVLGILAEARQHRLLRLAVDKASGGVGEISIDDVRELLKEHGLDVIEVTK